MRSTIFRILIAAGLIAAAAFPSQAQMAPIRLILKDGSYQVATKYEIQGDRVHYFSAEREEWEDVPVSLIDWDATRKWQEEHSGHSHSAASAGTSGSNPATQSDAEEKAARAAEEKAEQEKQDTLTPEIAPGLRLPESGGVLIADVYRDKPELIPLEANGSEVKPQTGKNILRAAVNPLARPRANLELPGAHAKIQVHIPDPAIYAYFDPEEGPLTPARLDDLASRYRLVRVAVTAKAKRIVGIAKTSVSGRISEKENFVESKTEVVHNGGPWVRFRPAAPLLPGQYALVEIVDGRQINIDGIFDFGVNPSAPDNARPPNSGSGATIN